MIKIDKDVALGPKLSGRSGAKYPYADMQIGDSFFVPVKKGKPAQGSLAALGKSRGYNIATRNVTENGLAGIRVWRIADEPKLRAVK